MGKQAPGKNCFSFPEIERVGMGWEEVVMNLWRQQYPYPRQPGRCQVETRWQILYRKRHPSVGGHVLVQVVRMSGASPPMVRNGSQPFLSSYGVLSQYCHDIQPRPFTLSLFGACSTTELSGLKQQFMVIFYSSVVA